jgi:LMBR1 domain-containing protein 1
VLDHIYGIYSRCALSNVVKAYGLSAFPIGIIKGKKHLAEEFSDTAAKVNQTREQVNAIQSKYLAGGKKMSQKDQEQLDLLKRKERYSFIDSN